MLTAQKHAFRPPTDIGRRWGGVWGHLLVSASACILTVVIVGSIVYLIYKQYERHDRQVRIQSIISSLENRTAAELDERVAQLREKPRLAEFVLPELSRALVKGGSEKQICSSIEVARAFLNHRRIESALFALRRDPRESVAAEAVSALARVNPPQHAAEVLGRCLDPVKDVPPAPAVVDEACAGLFRIGEVGLAELRTRLPSLSVERRIWLAGFVRSMGGPQAESWLSTLASDGDPRVHAAAIEKPATSSQPTSMPAGYMRRRGKQASSSFIPGQSTSAPSSAAKKP